jgi:hypothetical protein
VGFEFEKGYSNSNPSFNFLTPLGPIARARPNSCAAQLFPSPLFPFFFPHASRPNTIGPAQLRELSHPFPSHPPGAADGRVPPVSFPLPPDRPRPRLPLASAASPRSATGASNRLPLFSSFPRRGPAPLRHPPARAPLRSTTTGATARPRAPPFPPRLGRPHRKTLAALQPPDDRRVATARGPGIAALDVRARAASPRIAHKTPRPPPKNPSHPHPCSLSDVAAPEREKEGGGGAVQEEEDPEPSEKDTDATRSRARTTPPPELHQAGDPYDDINAAALLARPRPTGLASPQPRAPSPSAPSVSAAAAVPFPFPYAAGDAEEPSVASPRNPHSPSGRRADFCAGARRAAVFPATAVALPPPRRAAGPGCRCPVHGTATPRPWNARTRARACAPVTRDPITPA